MIYRILLRSSTDDVVGDEEVAFSTDAAAIDHARKYLFDWQYEIWQGSMLIASGPAETRHAHAAAATDPLLRDRRIFVVEDEAMISMLMEEMLQEMGAQSVEIAASLREAKTIASATAADVALLDVRLGSELSYPVADVLRERAIPFLFVSGYAPHMGGGSWRDAITLTKPFTNEQLAHAIHVLLNAPHRGCEARPS